MKKEYIEWEGLKLIIEEKKAKSKKNQFNTGYKKVERKPFKRRDEVTFELIIKCLLGAFAWGALIYTLLSIRG